MAVPLIQARALFKTFGTAAVLRGVNLAVMAGGGAMISGRNGAGKSTLLAILAGLSAPTSGDALLFGKPSRELAPAARKRLGIVTHQSLLYPNLSARENLEFCCALYGVASARVEASSWLDRVGLAAAAGERVRTFSRGMEQRLTLARALIHRPDALLMDEPFAALDADGAARAAALIAEAATRGCAIVITAHRPLAIAGAHFDQYEIDRGRLQAPSAGAIADNQVDVRARASGAG